MVQRQRRGDVGVRGEYNQADAVVGPLVNELLQDLLGHLQPIGGLAVQFKILGRHAE